jgi:hypothetical protein
MYSDIEISDVSMALLIQENIVGLDVSIIKINLIEIEMEENLSPMDDSFLMQKCKSRRQLSCIESYCVFWYRT